MVGYYCEICAIQFKNNCQKVHNKSKNHIKKLKKNKNNNIMNNNIMNNNYLKLSNLKLLDILDLFIKNINLSSFLLNFSLENKDRNYTFELLLELFLLFNCLNENIIMKMGDSCNLQDYVLDFNKKLRSGSSEGCADIKYYVNNILKLVSVKFFENNLKKNIDKHYDIHSISNKWNNYNNKKIVICSNETKESLSKKIKKTHNKDRKKEILNDIEIIDINDMKKYYLILRNILINNNYFDKSIKDKKELLYKLSNIELKRFIPYFHQYVIVKELIKKFENYDELLLNALCRCGKTFCCGYLSLIGNFKRVLLITPRITSTKESYNRMLYNYNEFIKYKKRIIEKDENNKILLNKEDEYVFLTLSRQYLIDRDNNEIDYSYFDLIVIDEAHLACQGKIDKHFDKMKESNVKVLHMTGTSEKVENNRCFESKQIVRYSLDHINSYQNGEFIYDYNSIKYLKDYKKQYVKTKDEITKYYNRLPNIKLFYMDLLKMNKKNNIKEKFFEEYGFSFKKLLELKNKNKFKNEESICNIFNMIFGKKVINGELFSDNIIRNINKDSGNDYSHNINLVFLEYGEGIPIGKIAPLLQKLLSGDKRISSSYDIIYYTSDVNNYDNNIVRDIEKKRLIAKSKNKSLIVLLGGMCELGASIEYCQNVVLFNNFKSLDSYIQKAFRCMTEHIENGNKIKYQGNVIDFNMNRILSCTLKVNNYKNDKKNDYIESVFNSKMIEIIEDNYELREISNNELLKTDDNMKKYNILNKKLYDFKNKEININKYKFSLEDYNKINKEITKKNEKIESKREKIKRKNRERKEKDEEEKLNKAMKKLMQIQNANSILLPFLATSLVFTE